MLGPKFRQTPMMGAVNQRYGMERRCPSVPKRKRWLPRNTRRGSSGGLGNCGTALTVTTSMCTWFVSSSLCVFVLCLLGGFR